MAKTVFRRNRRAKDPSLGPASAPVVLALDYYATVSTTVAEWAVIDPSSGNYLPFGTILHFGPIDWIKVGGVPPASIVGFDAGGDQGIRATWAAPALGSNSRILIPSWSQAIRGLRGEWVMGQALYVPAFE